MAGKVVAALAVSVDGFIAGPADDVPGQAPPTAVPYTFVTDGIASAVRQALDAAGGKDVRLMGASIVQQRLRAALLDELTIELVPVVLGRGDRLLDGLTPGTVGLELAGVVDAPGVTHLTYRVIGRRPKLT
jgi:dihydrofolate reductase